LDPEVKLQILRAKRELYDQLRRQGLLSSKTMDVMDDSYVRTWELLNKKGPQGLGLAATTND
jgi:hypothetical protein